MLLSAALTFDAHSLFRVLGVRGCCGDQNLSTGEATRPQMVTFAMPQSLPELASVHLQGSGYWQDTCILGDEADGAGVPDTPGAGANRPDGPKASVRNRRTLR